jgi:ABC-type transport system involved in cytochrome c biogenesis permease component
MATKTALVLQFDKSADAEQAQEIADRIALDIGMPVISVVGAVVSTIQIPTKTHDELMSVIDEARNSV